ncbi:MAG: hypothetical protein JW936_10585 [Sedimentisphaerales bacterium]|nr:hypothetical protein [Sedimentisphaerales bacterium]
MGIIYCANCEGKCSDQINNCPHCGHPINKVTKPPQKPHRDEPDIDDDPPTARQLRFAKNIGLKVPNGTTKWELSDMLDKAVVGRNGFGTKFVKIGKFVSMLMAGIGLYLVIAGSMEGKAGGFLLLLFGCIGYVVSGLASILIRK